jgi:hypothetical protein
MWRIGILAVSSVAVLATASANAASSHHSAPPRCPLGHAHQIAANAQAQLFEGAQPAGIGVFGCTYGSRRFYLLGNIASFSSQGGGGIEQEKLFGPLAAYEAVRVIESPQEPTEKRLIIVRDLRNGRIVHRVPTGTPLGNAPYVIAMVVKTSNGDTAWIVGVDVNTYRLNLITKRTRRVLGSGPINPSSLKIRGSKLYWMEAGTTMSVPLS